MPEKHCDAKCREPIPLVCFHAPARSTLAEVVCERVPKDRAAGAGMMWRKADERDFPVTGERAVQRAAARSEVQDLAAAMAGAGGGRSGAGKPD